MMDAYSFDRNPEEMKKSYDLMHEVYLKIFDRLCLDVVPTISDNGTMGGKISEEFQVFTKLGEDKVYYDKDRNLGLNEDVLSLEDKDDYLKQMGIETLDGLTEHQAVECGNNFQLGTRYSDSMNLTYIDKDGKQKPYYMGCYGIGVGRIMACLIENNVIIGEDNKIKGFSLPYDVAPYKVQIIYNNENIENANNLYCKLQENNIQSIIDDRDDLGIGTKIKDVTVIGTPKMIVIGKQFDGKNYIVEDTKTNEKQVVPCEGIVSALSETNAKSLKLVR